MVLLRFEWHNPVSWKLKLPPPPGGKVARRLHPMLTNWEEHRKVFSKPPLIAFRRCKSLKDILVRASEGSGGLIRRDVLVLVNLVVKSVMS